MLFGETMHNVSLPTHVIALIAAFALLSAICPLPASAAGRLQIMTATTDLAALAQEIGGDRCGGESRPPGFQEPPFLEAQTPLLPNLPHPPLFLFFCPGSQKHSPFPPPP